MGFKELFVENSDYSLENEYTEVYNDVIKDIVNPDKNVVVMGRDGRLDIQPRNLQRGDDKSGPELAQKLLPEIKKAIKPYGFDAKIVKVEQSFRDKRRNRPVFGGIQIYKK